MKITGKLHKIFDTQQITDKFSKREFILEIFNGTFVNYPKFEFQNKNCSKLDGFAEGQKVEIEFDLRGRAWESNGKTQYFNTLVAWKANSIDNENSLDESTFPADEESGESEELPF